MRRITLWLLSTVAALVLLFSYRTSTEGAAVTTAASVPAGGGTVPAAGTGASGGPGDGGSSGGGSSGGGTNEDGSSGATGSSGSTGNKTYAGSVAQTRWGPVQVTITVVDGRITDVAVPAYPQGNHRDEEINAYALPVLRQETLSAQSASIDTVSGATVTSDGYRESLQAALDAAQLA